ncbi:hypothetical protein GGQ80_001009 [Sphingomonas jinjuensis]|uniref:Uncharacterized protein n=1 Tax=Sphingomonas jinjuensis TaxID=535907 RepID=A0A840F968_9SPHN|nr:hypothetical protein [Sphingomonas jinjuensis]MBB4153121.1 hypothetical protein [Sphingomonas jinjuensis]
MLNTKMTAVRDVTEQLVKLEALIDAAMIAQAGLQSTLIEARRKANLPLDAGLDGFERVAGMAPLLATARSHVNRAHYDFRAVRDGMRMPIHAYGDYGDTPDSGGPNGVAAPLKIVA